MTAMFAFKPKVLFFLGCKDIPKYNALTQWFSTFFSAKANFETSSL